MLLKLERPWNVLVFPAASEVGLEIRRALGNLKEVALHGANLPGPSVAAMHFARLHELPSIYEADCLPRLQELIAREKIDAIFPAHDDVALWLAQRTDKLAATVVSSPREACEICRSKRRTYEALKDIVPVPDLWNPDDAAFAFPVFVKPDCGQGSLRARPVASRALLESAMASEPDLIATEYLPGREYTVDCFSQSGRGLLYAQARERVQTRTGISTLSRFADLPEALPFAEKIGAALRLRGAWFFQLREDRDGRLKLLEAAPRIAGSMALSRAAGPNFALLSLYEAAGRPVEIQRFRADFTLGRSLDVRILYDRPIGAMYIDLDDTLIIRGEVNAPLAALVFQCRNRGVPVHLITRHKGDLQATLEKFRLAALFDRVIHIRDDEVTKASYITEDNAIFIDDSFQERHAAAGRSNIRCFDPAGALCLLDGRG